MVSFKTYLEGALNPELIARDIVFGVTEDRQNVFYTVSDEEDRWELLSSHYDLWQIVHNGKYNSKTNQFELRDAEVDELRRPGDDEYIQIAYALYPPVTSKVTQMEGVAGTIDMQQKIVAFWQNPNQQDIDLIIQLLNKLKQSTKGYMIHVSKGKVTSIDNYIQGDQDKEKAELMRQQHLSAQAKKALGSLKGKPRDITKGYRTIGDSVEGDNFEKDFDKLKGKQDYIYSHPDEFPAPDENDISQQFQKNDLVRVNVNVADIPNRWPHASQERLMSLPKKGIIGRVVTKRADGPTADEVKVLVDFSKGRKDPIALPASVLTVVYRP